MNTINFKELTIEDKGILDPFFNETYHENAHMNFTNLFMWRKPYNIMWTIVDEILYMKATYDERVYALPPLGFKDNLYKSLDVWQDYFKSENLPFMMVGLEENLVEEMKAYKNGTFEFFTNRDDDDYVYLAENLIKLSGRKFHSKKNHLNNFRKNYPDVKFVPICDNIITLCKLRINSWVKQRVSQTPDDPFIIWEREAIIEVLNHFKELKLKGGALYDGTKVYAFTFGELLNPNMAVIHVEKADPEVNGAYAAINQGFVENCFADIEFINREEDMGIEGLRRAKESYRPVRMVKKYLAKLV